MQRQASMRFKAMLLCHWSLASSQSFERHPLSAVLLCPAERIAGFHGSQCGFCTPGMVVACHSALTKSHQKGKSATPLEMEKSIDGNLCRCTGYRPILDACKVI